METTPTRRVVLLCGPPGAGKTTWARAAGLAVYDRDDQHWRNEAHFNAAIAHLRADPHAQAVVIRAGARWAPRIRAASRIAATEVRVLDVPAEECIRRVTARARATQPRAQQIAAVRAWWARYEPSRPLQGQDPRKTEAFKQLAVRVVGEEPLCWLRLPGCTRLSTTADHVVPVKRRPDLVNERSNLRGACKHCNSSKGAKAADELDRAARQRPPALAWFEAQT